MDSPPHRPREDTSPPMLPAEDLSGVFETPPGFGDNIVGTIVAGRYTVTQMIGSGGMGCVYQAFDAANQRDVALKVLKNDRIGSSHNVQRFMQEARVLSMLQHPNVVHLIDFGQDENGVLYLAMELLTGTDLADYLSERRPLQWDEVSEIALQLVRGLQIAHQRGIVHRDLKPENVYLVPGRPGGPHQVKLLDFGIAKVLSEQQSKLTTDGSVFGTARYMSPEQASGEPVDARSDIYGVGILLYEMLTGNPPFTGDDFMRVAHQHVSEQPRPLSHAAPEQIFLPNVEDLVMRALAKGKHERYGSMADFEAAILATQFDADSTMAVVVPNLPTAEPDYEQTTIKSMADIPAPPPRTTSPRLPLPPRIPLPPPVKTAVKPVASKAAKPAGKPGLPNPIAASRRARSPKPTPRPRHPSLEPVMPPAVEGGYEATVIKSAPLGPEPTPAVDHTVIKSVPGIAPGTAAPHDDYDRTVIRSAPEPSAPQPVAVEPTVAIHRSAVVRPDPRPVGGTVVVQAPQAPSLPDFDDPISGTTQIQGTPPGPPPPIIPPAAGAAPLPPLPTQADPFPSLPPPSIDSMDVPSGAQPPPVLPPPSAAVAPAPPMATPFAASPAAAPHAGAPPPVSPRAAPGRGFVAPSPAGSFGAGVPGGPPPMRDDARPVFAKEQNANWMATGLAPQRLSSAAPPTNTKDVSPEDALRTPFVGGQWVETEENNATNGMSGEHDGGELLLRPPVREVSRNLVVAVVIISILSLAVLSFMLWTMFREEPGNSVTEPHPATMAGQPKPTLFEPTAPEGPKFPENEPIVEDDDDEPPPEPPKRPFKPTAKPIVQTLSNKQISDGFGKARTAINACAKQHGAIKGTSLQVGFDVVDSRARNAKCQPPHNLTPLGRCVAGAVNQHARFPKSKQPSMAISRKVSF